LARAADVVLEQGVQSMVISLGKDGVYYKNRLGVMLRKRTKEVAHMANATGAGDALTAGLVYGYVNNLDLDLTLDFAMTSAILTINHKNTINPELSTAMVTQNIKEWKL
jgi:pseudouridine kinase